MKQPKVSVIIPIYGAEAWIERCARSLFEQTLDDIEYIFVDDCSPDDSIKNLVHILESYPQRKKQVRILRHEVNKGVAAARTTGMKAATGEYMIHCDPDDWIELYMYEKMYSIATENNADIVMCNFMLNFESGIAKKQTLAKYSSPQKCIEGYCKKGGFYYSSCNKLVRRQLIEEFNIFPPAGINLGEDANMSFRMLHYAKSIVYCDEYFYHYSMVNTQSLSKKKETWANFEMGKRNTDDIVDFLMSRDSKRYRVTANFLKFCAKLKILRSDSSKLKEFYNTYKDCRKDILKFSRESLKVRLLYYCLLHSYPLLTIYQWKKAR